MIPAVVSPHPLATQAGLELLRRGASASEATVAIAAVLSVVWPNMSGLGGDAFFLLFNGGEVRALNARGFFGAQIELRGEVIPERGPGSILTVPGAVAGWQSLLEGSPLHHDLLAPAIRLAEEGAPLDARLRRALRPETEPWWRAVLANRDETVFRQPQLARTLWMMADGHDFYCSEISLALCETLAEWGVPITVEDFHFQHADWEQPLRTSFGGGAVWTSPDTPGLATRRLLVAAQECGSADDRERMIAETKNLWPSRGAGSGLRNFLAGGAVAFSVVDENGCAVSALQSLYVDWGSGMWCPRTGVLLQNRGCAFSLDRLHSHALAPRSRPASPLCSALVTHGDELAALVGTTGGEAQPQILAQVLTALRAAGKSPEEAVGAFRWLWGPTENSVGETLFVENEESDHDLFGHCNLLDLRSGEPRAVADWRTG